MYAIASPFGLLQGSIIWITNCAILFLVICYCFLISFTAQRSAKLRIVYSASLVSVVVLGLLLSGTPKMQAYFDVFDTYDAYRTKYEIEYYGNFYHFTGASQGKVLEYDKVPEFSDEIVLEPTDYNVELSAGILDATVNCDITAVVTKTSNKQTFTLYHAFIVKEIIKDSQSMEFQQSGDYIEVYFPEPLTIGETINLHFSYKGLSSASFPCYNEIVYLPSNYPWLPRVGFILPPEKVVFSDSDNLALYEPWVTAEPISFSLKFNANRTVYVNLPEASDGGWAGNSSRGLTVISSALLSKSTVDDYVVYYPETLTQYLKDFVQRAKNMTNSSKEVLDHLGVSGVEFNSKTIVFLPFPPSGIMEQEVLQSISGETGLFFNSVNNAYLFLFGYDYSQIESVDFSQGFRSILTSPNFRRAENFEPVALNIKQYFYRWRDSVFMHEPLVLRDYDRNFYEFYENTGTLYDTTREQADEFEEKLSKIIFDNDINLANSFFSWWYTSCQTGDYPTMKQYIAKADEILSEGELQ